ncbi:tetratricopeptide repeat protein [Xylophilus sp. GW821-FHT01B05]
MSAAAPPSASEVEAMVALFRAGQLEQMLPLAEAFTGRYPQHGLGWMLSAAAHKAAKRLQDALRAQLQAVAVMPPKAELFSNLGNIQYALGQWAEAEESYQAALRLDAHHLNAHYNYGLMLLDLERGREAELHLQQLARVEPQNPDLLRRLGHAQLLQHRLLQGRELLRHSLALQADSAEAASSLSYAELRLGNWDAAVAAAHEAVRCAPENPLYLGNLLFVLEYGPLARAEALALARSYGQMVSATAAASRYRHWAVSAGVPLRGPLRVGFVSGDFRNHPVTFFLLAWLRHLDPARVECHGYATMPFEDDYTRELRSSMASWQLLPAGDDVLAARRIHEDGIHILVDLTGHSGHGRLPVFAYKPAPVQVAWLGYFATTGLPEMDVVLADPVSVPAEDEWHFTERVHRLPHTRLCFSPPLTAVEAAPSPAETAGHVTYGCFQPLSKVSDLVLQTWARIMARVPTARLRWQHATFADAGACAAMRERWSALGLPPAQLNLSAGQDRIGYLEAYRHVDLVLDTFPFPGGTTTCEALWMGVPTLTLRGHSMVSRQGAGLMAAAGLSQWVVDDLAQYEERAVALALDLPALIALRAGMRERVCASPLFDGARFALDVQQAFEEIWRASATAETAEAPRSRH